MIKNLKLVVPIAALAASLSLSAQANTPIDPSMVNQTFNNVTTIHGGNYYNTAGSATTFNGTGNMTLPAGTTIKGFQVDLTGGNYFTNGNGGSFIFNTPGQFAVHGTIDVSATKFGGMGGFVTANVGSFLMGPTGQINATGWNGPGGRVVINANGPIEMQSNNMDTSIITVSGQPLMTADGQMNSAVMIGSIVNLNGIVKADGIAFDGGKIVLTSTAGDVNIGSKGVLSANGGTGSAGVNGGNGGTINITATDGVINNQGTISVNGGDGYSGSNPTSGGTGGTLTLTTITHSTVTDTQTVTETTYTTETRTITNDQGPIGKFIIDSADPDKIDFSNMNVGDSITLKVDGMNSDIHGFGNKLDGTVVSPEIDVKLTRTDSNTVILTATDKNGNTLTFFDSNGDSAGNSVSYNMDNNHDTHFSIQYNATLQMDGQSDQVVSINRDFNMTNPDHKGQANFEFLPQATGSNYVLTSTETVQVPHTVTTVVEVPHTVTNTDTQTVQGQNGSNGVKITPDDNNGHNDGDHNDDGHGDNGGGNNDHGNGGDNNGHNDGDHNNDGHGDNGRGNDGHGNDGGGDDGGNNGGENPPPVNPPSTSPTPTKLNFNTSGLYGLFQQNSGEVTIESGTIAVIALDKPEMFFDPTYKRAGEEILNMAYKQYQQELAMGVSKEEATQTMTDMLLASGVNQTVAMAYSGIGFVPMAAENNFKPLSLDGTEKNTKLIESLSTIANMITPQGVDNKQMRDAAGERLKVSKIRITLPASSFGGYLRRY
jgi:hypothetical protein